jgi:predicted nucleic acid-binding protein
MGKRKRIYLDEMVLTFLSGAKEYSGPKKEVKAIEALRVTILSGSVVLVVSFVHRLALSGYKNRKRRGKMRHVWNSSGVDVFRSKHFDRLMRQVMATGLGRRDAAHVAAARVADATLLTLDREMLHLARRHRGLFGIVCRPSEWTGSSNEAEEE